MKKPKPPRWETAFEKALIRQAAAEGEIRALSREIQDAIRFKLESQNPDASFTDREGNKFVVSHYEPTIDTSTYSEFLGFDRNIDCTLRIVYLRDRVGLGNEQQEEWSAFREGKIKKSSLALVDNIVSTVGFLLNPENNIKIQDPR